MYDSIEHAVKVPDDYRYNIDHLWMEYTDDGNIRCGVTEYLCDKTGEIISVEYIRNIINMEVIPGDSILSIESVKESIGIKAPLSGTIIEINSNSIEQPELINSDPYGEGWLFIIASDDSYEYEHQMYSDEYEHIVMKEKEDNIL